METEQNKIEFVIMDIWDNIVEEPVVLYPDSLEYNALYQKLKKQNNNQSLKG
jgi:hypothetical protein